MLVTTLEDVDRIKIGDDKVSGMVWSGGSFESISDINIKVVWPVEGDPLHISKVKEVVTRQGT